MSDITFKPKPRKDPDSALWMSDDGSQVFIGRDYALQNEIDESIRKRNARSCFRECHTCGTCANSKRDAVNPQVSTTETGLQVVRGPGESYDENSKSWINCRSCEPFRWHDCNNGFMRNSRGEAEPFTADQISLIESSETGKPLM